jgi:(2Fe-2S) ferredoxin
MKTWYQVYRDNYWYTSTTDKEEAETIANDLKQKGYSVEIKIK